MIEVTQTLADTIEAMELGITTSSGIAKHFKIGGPAASDRVKRLLAVGLALKGDVVKGGYGRHYHYTGAGYFVNYEKMVVVTDTESDVMQLLESGAAKTTREVINAAKLDRKDAGNAIFRLCNKGLLERKPIPGNSRNLIYVPTGLKYKVGVEKKGRKLKTEAERQITYKACDLFNFRGIAA